MRATIDWTLACLVAVDTSLVKEVAVARFDCGDDDARVDGKENDERCALGQQLQSLEHFYGLVGGTAVEVIHLGITFYTASVKVMAVQ